MGSGRRREGNLALLSLLLDRSKNAPLTIHLDCNGDDEDVLNMLSPHISRARVLYFRINLYQETKLGLALRNFLSGPTHFPFLRSLSPSIYSQHQFSSLFPTFAHAPLLERLHVKMPMVQAQWIDNIGIPWSQIRYHNSVGLLKDINTFLKSLLLMPNLIHLDIDDISFRYYYRKSKTLPYIRLEHLTCLRLQHETTCEIWDHLAQLELPALTEMDLRDVPLGPVKSLLERSKCGSQLSALTLWGTSSGEGGRETIKEILFMTPNVVSFDLQSIADILEQSRDFIQVFTPDPDAGRDGLPSGILFSKLTTLQIQHGKNARLDVKDFMDRVFAREVLPTVKRLSFPRAWGTTVYEISGVHEVKKTYYQTW